MYPGLRSVPTQPHRIRIPGQPIHNSEADGARLRYLQPQVIVNARHRMIMLMNNEMMALVMLIPLVKFHELGIGETWAWRGESSNPSEMLGKEFQVVFDLYFSCFYGGKVWQMRFFNFGSTLRMRFSMLPELSWMPGR